VPSVGIVFVELVGGNARVVRHPALLFPREPGKGRALLINQKSNQINQPPDTKPRGMST